MNAQGFGCPGILYSWPAFSVAAQISLFSDAYVITFSTSIYCLKDVEHFAVNKPVFFVETFRSFNRHSLKTFCHLSV